MNGEERRTFTLHWKHGEVQTVSAPDQGNQLDTLAQAMSNAGIGGGALPALDYWREVSNPSNAADLFHDFLDELGAPQ